MQRSSYSGLRANRGFPHADPASFVSELTPLPIPADLSTTTHIFSRIFIIGGARSPLIGDSFVPSNKSTISSAASNAQINTPPTPKPPEI
jgi:hypothetical protein